MNMELVLDLARDAIFVLLTIGAPVMLTALGVGMVIALFQALTQIQEMTLTFVPKILVVFITLIFTLPFMLRALIDFTLRLFDQITAISM